MRLLDRFFRKPEQPAARGNRTGKAVKDSALRVGMWVMVDLDGSSVPGLVLGRDAATNLLHVMVVDRVTGENSLELPIGQGIVRQARLSEIPVRRRPNADVGAALGYFP